MTDANPKNGKTVPAGTQPERQTDGPETDGPETDGAGIDDGTETDAVVVPPAAKTDASGARAEPTEEPLYDLVEVAPAAPSAAASTSPSTSSATAAESPGAPEVAAGPANDSLQPEPARSDAPSVENSAGQLQMIYVPSPLAPPRKGNRRYGTIIAVASTVIFAALYAGALAIIRSASGVGPRFDFLGSAGFYIPVVFFLVGFIVLVAIVNRAGWWAYVLGSLFVAMFVYFGTIATGLIMANVILETPAGAARLFAIALSNPFVIAAALLAREISMWMGAAISARGRRVKVKNAETKAEFERETAERNAQYEQARYRANESAV